MGKRFEKTLGQRRQQVRVGEDPPFPKSLGKCELKPAGGERLTVLTECWRGRAGGPATLLH
jgi:hypothetical protein